MTNELTQIPPAITAGDAANWRLVLPLYHASDGWAASYVLVKATNQITINTSADGDDHLVSIASSTTASWPPGVYNYALYATKDGDRQSLAYGTVEITPDFASATGGMDARTPAERRLESLENTYDTLAARHLASKSGGSFSTTDKELTELREQINKQRAVVVSERRKKQIREGKRPGTKIKVRFMR